jgi:NADPH-dependent curcumin reductase CurA
VYFDNVGGVMLDAALGNLASGARIVVCGRDLRLQRPR